MYLPNQSKPVLRRRVYSIGKPSQSAIGPSDDEMDTDDDSEEDGGEDEGGDFEGMDATDDGGDE